MSETTNSGNGPEIEIIGIEEGAPGEAMDDILKRVFDKLSPEQWAKVEAGGIMSGLKNMTTMIGSAGTKGLTLFVETLKTKVIDADAEMKKIPENVKAFLQATVTFAESEIPKAAEQEAKRAAAETSTTSGTSDTTNPPESSSSENPGT